VTLSIPIVRAERDVVVSREGKTSADSIAFIPVPPPVDPVGHGPDLIVTDLLAEAPDEVHPSVWLFQGTVVNQGSAVAGPSQARLRIDLNNDGTWDYHSTNNTTGSLQPDASEVKQWVGIASMIPDGIHFIEICADIQNSVAEIGEKNTGNIVFFQRLRIVD